jgi:DNA end-binding protein Ku
VAARKTSKRSGNGASRRRRGSAGDDAPARGGKGRAPRSSRAGEAPANGEAASRDEAAHGGPRAFWSGTITFGLVSVPVDLYPAVRSRRAPLRMLGPNDEPLQRRYYCSAEDEALTYDDIVRGYEWPDGSFTVVSDEELESLAPRKSRDIDLQRFVKRDENPAKLLERPYVLAPAGESVKAYHLLAATMEQTGRAGIATFVMRGREYLAAIFAEGGLLRAATMRFADELRTPETIGLPRAKKVAAAERKDVEAALTKLHRDELDVGALDDQYTSSLLALAEKKRDAGRDVVEVDEEAAADEAETADIIDIMSVLKQRLGADREPPRQSTSETRASSKPAHGSRARRRKSSGTSSKP